MINPIHLTHWIWTASVFFFCLFILIGLKKFLWNRLELWAGKTETSWDDLLLKRIQTPFTVLTYIGSIAIALQTTPPEIRNHAASILGTKIALIATILWLVDRLLTVLFIGIPVLNHFSKSMQILFLTVVRVLMFSLGLLIILDTLGISITPILASLGVGSIAVALALQDTLNNFFSGIYLLVDEPIRIGDFVRLEDGLEGHIEKIGWRSTRVRTLANNMVFVPNSKLASARITNFYAPDKEMGFGIDMGVAYDSDLEKVERITCEVAMEIMRTVPGGIPGHQPALRFSKFGDSSIDFTVGLRVAQFTDQYLVKHEFIKALHKRYTAEGISIPFPQRVVHLDKN